MAGRSDIQAGAAHVRLYVKNNDLLSGLKSVAGTIAIWSTGIVNTISLIQKGFNLLRRAISGPIEQFATLGSDIDDMSKRTGIATNALSELGYAAGQSGTTIEQLENGVRKMQKTISEAREGTKTAKDALAKLGITFEDLKETPDAQLELFADRISAIGDPAERAAAVMEVFGKMQTKLLPLFEGGAKGIRSLRQEAILLGQSMNPEDAANAAALGDSWDRVKSGLSGLALTVSAAVAPALLNILDVAKQVIISVSQWVQENDSLLSSFEGITAVLASGNWALAMEVASAAIILAWHNATFAIRKMWIDFKFFFLLTWEEATTGLSKLFVSAYSGIQRGWVTAISFLQSIWDTFQKNLLNGWQEAQKGIGGMIINAAEQSGAVSGEFATAWRESLNQPIEQSQASRSSQSDARQAEIEREKAAALAGITAEESARLLSLDKQKRAAQDAAGASADEQRKGMEDALAAAREDLARVNAQAAEIAAKRKAGLAAGGPEGPATDIAGLRKAASAATFSGAALIAMGQGGGPQERIARDMNESRKLLKELVEQGKKNPTELVFG